MKRLLLILLSSLHYNYAPAQKILDVYPISECDHNASSITDTNVVKLSPSLTKVTYLVSLSKEVFVSKVSVDKSTNDVEVSVYEEGAWNCIDMDKCQSFVVNRKVQYLSISHNGGCDTYYILIE